MHGFKTTALALLAGSTFALAAPAQAATTVLTFEGLGDLSPIGAYYGPEYVFTNTALALVDSDAGGSGNTANEPSGDTTMVFLDANSALLNVTSGFDTGFSFFYSSNSAAASVNVYSGFDGTGSLLGTINLVQQANSGCAGDPNGYYCNWTNAGVAFAGVAHSIDFGGTANFIVYDNITFGSDVAGGGAVPEPSAWALMILGFGAVGGAMRAARRRTSVSFA